MTRTAFNLIQNDSNPKHQSQCKFLNYIFKRQALPIKKTHCVNKILGNYIKICSSALFAYQAIYRKQ